MKDIYEQIQAQITAVPHIASWLDMVSILDKIVQRRPKHWALPLITCQAMGGAAADAVPVMAALGCLQISIILIDDLLDEDPRGQHHEIGMPAAANAAAAFQAAGLDIIAQANYPQVTRNILFTIFNHMVLATAYGQYLDSQSLCDEAAYWQQAELKSGPFFGTAFQVGALAGGADVETAVQLKQLGTLYGKLIQLHDDLGDVMSQPATPDWNWERPSLPILFARQVSHPEQERFCQLCQAIPEPTALAEAQEILIRCGAVSYCLHHVVTGYEEARTVLAAIQLHERAALTDLIEGLVTPVHALFDSLFAPAL